MPKCSMKNCKNNTSRTLKKDGISYFRFPRDPIRCEEWKSIVSQQRREDFFNPNRSSVVYSEHFLDEDMYVTAKGIKRVLKTAVLRVAIEPDNGDDTEVGPTMFVLDNKKEFKSPTTSLSIGSILDTPRKVTIKSELHKCRRRLISNKKVIDNLRKKNLGLLKKHFTKECTKSFKEKN